MARVLLIDDEPELVELCEMILESAGHSVVHHHGQEHALELLRKPDSRPDIVFLDLVMPGMSGEEVLQQIRLEPQTLNIPVIVMSALPDAYEQAELMSADGFLGKPFGPEALTGAIEQALGPRQEPEEESCP